MTRMTLSRRMRIRNYEKKCFILSFYSDKSSLYKTIFFSENSLSLALFNTFNYKMRSTNVFFIEILPLMVDYACFSVKCINYQNVMRLKIFHFLQDLARFLQKMQFLPETQLLQIFARSEKVLQGFCKSFARCSFCKKFAKVVLIARFLQNFLKKLFFLWTRANFPSHIPMFSTKVSSLVKQFKVIRQNVGRSYRKSTLLYFQLKLDRKTKWNFLSARQTTFTIFSKPKRLTRCTAKTNSFHAMQRFSGCFLFLDRSGNFLRIWNEFLFFFQNFHRILSVLIRKKSSKTFESLQQKPFKTSSTSLFSF